MVGGSLGGHMALTWATQLPDRVAGAVAMATSPRLTSQALAFDVVGRNAILRDPAYQGGQYYDHGSGPAVGLAMARMLGHITYLSREGDDAEVRRPAAASRTTDRRRSSRRSSPSAPTWPTRATSSSSGSTPTATWP